MDNKYDVFISYSVQDQKVVEGICGFLEREGYRCFVAYRDIPRGMVWASAITEALDTSKMMVVVFSGAFNMSKQTDREIEIASENDMPILTYRVADVVMTGAKKYYLKNLNWIDAFPNPENCFGRLLDSVVKLIGPSKAAKEKAERLAELETERKAGENERKIEQERRKRERAEAQRRADQEKANQLKISDDPQPMPRKKLWITLGAVAALVLLLVLLWPKKNSHADFDTKEEPALAELDTKAFQDCRTVADYRNYIADYGQSAQHYAVAKGFIDRYVADSMQHVADSLAQALAPQLAQQQMQAQQQTSPPIVGTDSVSCTGFANGHEWVDLGLPSGTLWATCNVDANKPEGYGKYYAWGETKTKRKHLWTNYKYAKGTALTKYCNNSIFGNNGFTDNLTQLQSGDDPASINWGGDWCIPSEAQWDELLANTTSLWTTQNGKAGRLFTSKENGQSIFLPAAGRRCGKELSDAGSYGYYWSRSLDTDSPSIAWFLNFGSDRCGMRNNYTRICGFAVRPIRQE